jgi:hypothetical protein
MAFELIEKATKGGSFPAKMKMATLYKPEFGQRFFFFFICFCSV